MNIKPLPNHLHDAWGIPRDAEPVSVDIHSKIEGFSLDAVFSNAEHFWQVRLITNNPSISPSPCWEEWEKEWVLVDDLELDSGCAQRYKWIRDAIMDKQTHLSKGKTTHLFEIVFRALFWVTLWFVIAVGLCTILCTIFTH